MNLERASSRDAGRALRGPADQAERMVLRGYELLRGRLAPDGRPWPDARAALLTVRGMVGVDTAGMADHLGIARPAVDDLESGRVHPALVPGTYLDTAPWLPWHTIVGEALAIDLPPVWATDRHWPAGTAAAWLAERRLIHDPAPARHPAAGHTERPPHGAA